MSLDLALFRLINIAWGWEFLAPAMRVLSTFKYWIPLLLPLVLWMLLRDGRRGRVTLLLLLLVVPASDQLSSHLLKPMVARPRPCRSEAGIEGVRTHGVRCSRRGSFPSSHAANVGAVAVLMGLRYRRARIPAGLLAFLVGYSRIYLGVHYPSDVAAGWALGAVLAGMAERFRLTSFRGPPRLDVRGWISGRCKPAARRDTDTR